MSTCCRLKTAVIGVKVEVIVETLIVNNLDDRATVNLGHSCFNADTALCNLCKLNLTSELC